MRISDGLAVELKGASQGSEALIEDAELLAPHISIHA
jgi:hypothetical protein